MSIINNKNEDYSKQLAKVVANAALSKNAEDITILDMKNKVDFTDYFVICNGDNKLQIKAIADEIVDELEKTNVNEYNIEGYDNKEWILIDAYDVICHIFNKETRKHYDIENLWADVPQKRINDAK